MYKYKMYGLVPYNLSPMQQGIQFGHAVVEYAQRYFNSNEYQSWANNDKTFIVLNGGTTNNNPNNLGTLNKHLETIKSLGISYATFNEEDLGDQLTAIVFLVDERVWNKEYWVNYDENLKSFYVDPKELFKTQNIKEIENIIFLKGFLKSFKTA